MTAKLIPELFRPAAPRTGCAEELTDEGQLLNVQLSEPLPLGSNPESGISFNKCPKGS